jgi:hypothetical protein
MIADLQLELERIIRVRDFRALRAKLEERPQPSWQVDVA